MDVKSNKRKIKNPTKKALWSQIPDPGKPQVWSRSISLSSNHLFGQNKMQFPFQAVLTDIEGTTTSIDFVKSVLFPFASKNAAEFLQKIIAQSTDDQSDQYRQLIVDLINASNESQDPEVVRISSGDDLAPKLTANVQRWIQQDKKLTALKNLQGLIWEEGYRSGELKSHVYPDVPDAFQKFADFGVPIYIFSSGSIKAQQLLFSHTIRGDLTKFISGYFDTTTGPKFESDSYRSIVKQIGCPADKVVFLTDVEKEAFAASEAGLRVYVFLREGNVPITEKALAKFDTIWSFGEFFKN